MGRPRKSRLSYLEDLALAEAILIDGLSIRAAAGKLGFSEAVALRSAADPQWEGVLLTADLRLRIARLETRLRRPRP